MNGNIFEPDEDKEETPPTKPRKWIWWVIGVLLVGLVALAVWGFSKVLGTILAVATATPTIESAELQSLPAEALDVLPAVADACGTAGQEGVWQSDMAPFEGTKLVCWDDGYWQIQRMFFNGIEYLIPLQAIPTATTTPTATQTATATATMTPTLVVTETPEAVTPEPTETVVLASGACALDLFPKAQRFGVQLEVKKNLFDKAKDLIGISNDWEFGPAGAKRVEGDSTHPELNADADLSGCTFVIEGRKDLIEEHHIWILVPGDIKYLDPDKMFRAKEFSAYAYPNDWNVEDFSAAKPPIAAEFVDAKRINMQQNGYDWPIFVHLSSGNVLEFEKGDKVGAKLPNHCDFAEPARLNVAGVYDSVSKDFNASIGADGCWTAAKVDGQWRHWRNALDNVQFSLIEAWLMPSSWTVDLVEAWIAKQ